jgi:hypothetical protein
MKTYYYLYYCIYSLIKYVNSRNDIIQWSSMLLVSFFVGVNIIVLFDIIHKLFNVNLIYINRTSAQIAGGILIIFNYFIFIRKNRYKKILAEFENEKLQNYTRPLIVIFYVLLTFFSIFNLGSHEEQKKVPIIPKPSEIVNPQ